MTTAAHLAAIDLARSRGFDGGPDFHLLELATSEEFWEDDGTRRPIVEEQYEAERDGLTALLTGRWGAPTELDLWPVLERSMAGESIPEPWSTLSSHTPDLRLWRVDGRWIGLGVSQWDKELPFQLLAVVTTIDPPR
ncbi:MULTISPECIES: hypothetical protein [Streptomyces]|uniref:Uncharacterized protein n=1 Tax=Streptomyces venezuelae (strain ATCC 10712 / CBS 650.69 / DSM 40230 / JCM 4526 / NBRC 13096 / PD 04745) TaxID=953739 RepID=F2RA42_STRVP|nr:hypothetical protein [Streptomyces venezuelae]APE20272.1 hypothetical protein vnz_04115 [Streptomyces venezuelae]QER97673.1 hypothetical protein DEJ43_04155 [Streptomyces venezuelae ATCC 10712]CCA54142.1 hypothetical protein SVEN_0855 [Streptomyces venezuelae ATCC 10712]